MRIISGKHRGRRIQPPKGLPARPTMDQAKEALFNILSNQIHLDDISVLDLFAGTGNMSYEFISRGATAVTAVERHARSVGFIKNTFRDLNASHAKVTKMPVEGFLRSCEEQFDLIFMDPPYDYPGMEKLVGTIFERELIPQHGWVILEHRNTSHFEEVPHFETTRKYGTSCFSFFGYEED